MTNDKGTSKPAVALLGDGATTPWRVVNDPQAGRGLAFHRPFVLQRRETGCTICYCPDERLKRWKSETEAQRVCNRLNAMLAASPAAPAQSGEPVAYANARHLAEKMASIPAFRARTEYYDVPLFTRQPAPTERALTDEQREAIGSACAASKHSGAPEVVSYHKTFEKMLGAAQPARGVDHE